MINNYVNDAVNNFSDEIDTLGGIGNWKNYRDYLGLNEEGFKERINYTWDKSYDYETLEYLINIKLQKEGVPKRVKLNRGDEYINNYVISLLSPIFEEALWWGVTSIYIIVLVPIITPLLLIGLAAALFYFFYDIKKFFLGCYYFFGSIIVFIGIILYIFFFNFNDVLKNRLKDNIIADINVELNKINEK